MTQANSDEDASQDKSDGTPRHANPEKNRELITQLHESVVDLTTTQAALLERVERNQDTIEELREEKRELERKLDRASQRANARGVQ